MERKELKNEEKNRYTKIIERIFFSKFSDGMTKVPFSREEIIHTAKELKIELPKNLGDVIYSFKYRTPMPESIIKESSDERQWTIRNIGKGLYAFVLIKNPIITPGTLMQKIKIPDATPGIIAKYSLDDEQALLAKIRYNRLLDIFMGITCYSLQNHLRTSVVGIGQIETDEIYVGVDKKGLHYIFPVQAKGENEKIGIVQIEQDWYMCKEKFPELICIPIASQMVEGDTIALICFSIDENENIVIAGERHYSLVDKDKITKQDLEKYCELP